MRISTLALTIIALLLGACGAAPRSDSMRTAASAQIRGSAFYLERIQMPLDTVLDVQLINDRLVDTPSAVVAAQHFEHLQGPPYAFVLDYDPALLQAGMSYSLFAALRGADGHLEFITDTRVPVTPGSAGVVSFRLIRAATSP